MYPGFRGVELLDSGSGYWTDLFDLAFVFDGAELADGGVAPSAVVEDLEVFEDRVGEFDAGAPTAAVERALSGQPGAS
jgi:hypothetical protein